MTVSIDRKALAEAAHLALLATSPKDTVPILGHVLIEATGDRVHLSATNLDQYLTIRLESSCDGPASWATTVPARSLVAALDKLSGATVALEFNLLGEKLKLTAPNGGWRTLATLPTEDFPRPNITTDTYDIELPREALLSALDDVRGAASHEETRFYLNGIYVHAKAGLLHFVTTDGHRLHHRRMQAFHPSTGKPVDDMWPGIIWPNNAIAAMRAMLTKSDSSRVGIAVSDRGLSIELDGRQLWSKAIDGSFPDYRRVEPTASILRFCLTGKAPEIARAVAAVAAIGEAKVNAVRMTLCGEECTVDISQSSGSQGREPIAAAAFDGPAEFEIGFNAKYVQAALDPFGDGDIAWQFSDNQAPSLISGVDRDDLTVTLMPMRVWS